MEENDKYYKQKYRKYKNKYAKLKKQKELDGGYTVNQFAADFIAFRNTIPGVKNLFNRERPVTIRSMAHFVAKRTRSAVQKIYSIEDSIAKQLYAFIASLPFDKLKQLFVNIFNKTVSVTSSVLNDINSFGAKLKDDIFKIIKETMDEARALAMTVAEYADIAAHAFKRLFVFLNDNLNPIPKHIECFNKLNNLLNDATIDSIDPQSIIDNEETTGKDTLKSMNEMLEVILFCLTNLSSDITKIEYAALLTSLISAPIPGGQPAAVIAGTIYAIVKIIANSLEALTAVVTIFYLPTFDDETATKKIQKLKEESEKSMIFGFFPNFYTKIINYLEKMAILKTLQLKKMIKAKLDNGPVINPSSDNEDTIYIDDEYPITERTPLLVATG